MSELIVILIVTAILISFFLGRLSGQKSRDDEVAKLDLINRKLYAKNISNQKILGGVIKVFEEENKKN